MYGGNSVDFILEKGVPLPNGKLGHARLYDLTDFFDEEFFETKKVVHIPLKFKLKKS